MKEKDFDKLMVIIEQESEPMWFTNMYVDKPCMPCCLCYFILFVCAALSVMLGTLQPTLEGDKGRDYGVMTSVEQQSWDKITLGDEYMTNTSTAEFPQQSMFAGAIVFLYQARDGKNLLTVDAMKEMKKNDDIILKNADFKKFCLRHYNTELCQGVDANDGSVLAN